MSSAHHASMLVLAGAMLVPSATWTTCVAALPAVQAQEIPRAVRAAPVEQDAAPVGQDESDARYDLAKDLASHGKHQEALEQYLWVWTSTRNQQRWVGVRHSFLLSDMQSLAAAYPPAKEAFLRLVDAAQANMEVVSPITWIDWIEWTALCDRFSDAPARTRWYDPPRDANDRILGWYERHRDASGRISVPVADAKVEERIESDLYEFLVERRRFVDAVRVGGDLVGRARQAAESLRRMEAALRTDPRSSGVDDVDGFLASMHDFFLERQAPLYGVLLAAGEAEAAQEASSVVLGCLDTAEARMALVRAALESSDSRPPQLAAWLDEASAAGADVSQLRSRLDAAKPPR